ncbi:coiled-coil domain-containing protein 102A-like isoform X2 [Oratosquilla oratoria]|uniref:coiled-coil domain-containing protein 102A-like isoform X2 n=2 Tax=Oratosquilla oratoria TaxID=337810 RepID=UPI003F760E67
MSADAFLKEGEAEMMAQSGGSARRGAQPPPHPHPPHTHEPPSLSYHWHDKQELIQRELEEARARATQMEKTMRWWSDCTANWREKWSKVRSERNKAREEVRILRGRLEVAQRESGALRREKNDLEAQLAHISQAQMVRLRKDEEKHIDQNNHKRDSPERDGSVPTRGGEKEAEKLSKDEIQFIRDSKNTNFTLLEEMFRGHSGEGGVVSSVGNGGDSVNGSIDEQANAGMGVENVAVFSHRPGDATRLSEKCRTGRGVKELLCEDYLKDGAEKDVPDNSTAQRENDVEEELQNHEREAEQQALKERLCPSNQVSPSHRMSSMSDPLPETCQSPIGPGSVLNPRISAVSDPLSEVCGGSECSEGESVRSGDGGGAGNNRRVWRGAPSVLDDAGMHLDQEGLEQQVTMLKLRLDEATKTIQAERDEKLSLHRESGRWQAETNELRSRLEDLRASRQEAVKELVALRAQHQKEVQTLQLEMLDEASTRECIDRRLADLRAELERLQEENAAEWGRRERLESEKLGLERENKKLRAQVSDLEERLEKRTKMAASTPDSEVQTLKQELADKNKELAELKHAHGKLKKVLADKSVELQHCTRRADQYEAEVKRLRARVDELKKELAAAEDEVDSATNNIRKLQRSNDEYQESMESLEVQVEHLQSRLRNCQPALPLRTNHLLHDSDDPSEF